MMLQYSFLMVSHWAKLFDCVSQRSRVSLTSGYPVGSLGIPVGDAGTVNNVVSFHRILVAVRISICDNKNSIIELPYPCSVYIQLFNIRLARVTDTDCHQRTLRSRLTLGTRSNHI